ncbi:MAG: IS66 family transposase zinc-finger binding domain-containing protein [Propionivibrio sp.]|nr:IS66 family transposase zinc-finger binding domain-containing protein [Propionivibrio sp.]
MNCPHRAYEPESCTCGDCGAWDLVKIGEDINEQLDVEPARFSIVASLHYACRSVQSHHRRTGACRQFDGGSRPRT